MTVIHRTHKLEFNRNSSTINENHRRVYASLSHVPVKGVRSWNPTGVYRIERFSATIWTVTHVELGFAAKDDRNTTQGLYDRTKDSEPRRVGTFHKLGQAQMAAEFDYNKLWQEAQA